VIDRDSLGPAQELVVRATLYTDGGSRGNPGPSGIGYTLLKGGDAGDAGGGGQGAEPISSGGWFIGQATNNEAEYLALIWGLENALAANVRNLDIRLDSELVAKQLRGEYKVKAAGIKGLFSLSKKLLSRFASYDIRHVRRAYNSSADSWANAAMDAEAPVGGYSVELQLPAELRQEQAVLEFDGAPGPESKAPGAAGKLRMPKNEAGTMNNERKNVMTDEVKQGIYTLTVKEHFDAAHALVGYPGECRNLHGHTWDVEATISGRELDSVGIVYDFKSLKIDLLSILNQYDHKYLNEVAPFDQMNSTAENLARVIYEYIEGRLPAGIKLEEIVVWESPIAKLSYRIG